MQEYASRENPIVSGFDRSGTERSLTWHRLAQRRKGSEMGPLFSRLWRLAHRDSGWTAILCAGCLDQESSTFVGQPLVDYLRFLVGKYDCIIKESADGHR